MGVDIYRLRKFQRSNQNTCINQRPLVKVDDTVTGRGAGRRPLHRLGELALGKNVVARSCRGTATTTRTDPHLGADRSRRRLTSIHIEELKRARDTSWPEEITRDIPNVGEEALRNLDEAGIAISAPTWSRVTSWWARSPQGWIAHDAGGEAAARHLRREGSDVRDTRCG